MPDKRARRGNRAASGCRRRSAAIRRRQPTQSGEPPTPTSTSTSLSNMASVTQSLLRWSTESPSYPQFTDQRYESFGENTNIFLQPPPQSLVSNRLRQSPQPTYDHQEYVPQGQGYLPWSTDLFVQPFYTAPSSVPSQDLRYGNQTYLQPFSAHSLYAHPSAYPSSSHSSYDTSRYPLPTGQTSTQLSSASYSSTYLSAQPFPSHSSYNISQGTSAALSMGGQPPIHPSLNTCHLDYYSLAHPAHQLVTHPTSSSRGAGPSTTAVGQGSTLSAPVINKRKPYRGRTVKCSMCGKMFPEPDLHNEHEKRVRLSEANPH